jgi:sugar phosphate permease
LIAVIAFYYESDMSETVAIKLFYGIGEIIYGPQGVDLSNFSAIEKNVKRAVERTWEGITNWLVKAFVVDLEHQYLSVMALINRSEHLYWELVPHEGTPQWRSFIRNACLVGLLVILFIQVFQKGSSSSQVHEEAEDVDEGRGGEEGEGAEEGDSEGEQTSRGYDVTGSIDEGQENPKVMRHYQRELIRS